MSDRTAAVAHFSRQIPEPALTTRRPAQVDSLCLHVEYLNAFSQLCERLIILWQIEAW